MNDSVFSLTQDDLKQLTQDVLGYARKAGASWTGQWWTTVPGRMSVCEIKR